jgi:hypothetical protein
LVRQRASGGNAGAAAGNGGVDDCGRASLTGSGGQRTNQHRDGGLNMSPHTHTQKHFHLFFILFFFCSLSQFLDITTFLFI